MNFKDQRLPRLAALAAAVLAVGACQRSDESAGTEAGAAASSGLALKAPVAEQRPHEVRAPHGAVRVDEYYWLRDDARQHPQMLDYLKAENAYADQVLAPQAELKEKLYAELVGRIKQDDSSVPYLDNGYWYYTRFEEGREYPIHARRQGSMEAPEEILLDLNQLAQGKGFYQVSRLEVSPDNRLLAYFEDDSGRRQYTLRVKNLETGELLPVEIKGLSPSLAWTADSASFFYVENDPETLLTKRVRRHVLGQAEQVDLLVYEEADPSFYMGVGTTTSEKYICISVSSTVSDETRCTLAAAPGDFEILAPRERDFEYGVDHLGDRWVIRTNWNAENFKLMQASEADIRARTAWTDLIPHDPEVFISGFALFNDFIAVSERSNGLTRLRLRKNDGAEDYVAADESAYAMGLSTNAEPDTDWLRYTYTSLTTPATTYELNVKTGERKLLKEQPVLGGFDKSNYVTERLWATARDGAKVPVSVLYHKDFKRDGKAPLLQYGYGSYGNSIDPAFNSNVISLVDRGMVYAIAHIRGGQEMGRAWYEAGKLKHKMNTFTDFIDVTDFLVAEKYAAPDRVAAMGGSAGGLLVGAVANLRPDLYRGIVTQVPFVDVVTTMLDESIPLTTNEFDEWGNPKQKAWHDYMLSYSPYDNVRAQAYPAMLVETGLWDSQVQYYEPAKWVAKLRANKTDANPLLFHVNMEAGHGGKSGRFRKYRDVAMEYAFLLTQAGVER
jgi:oligopeptidase B